MTDPSIRRAFAEAALKRAANFGWRDVTLRELAQAAGRPIADFHPLTPADAFDCVDEYFDRAAAEGGPPDEGGAARDRLFDMAMRRFEAMELHRAGLLAMDKALSGDPLALTAAYGRLTRTARWLLALAETEDSASGAARAQALALALREARREWARETSGDFAKTMAALDRGLRRSERFFESVGRVARSFKPAAATARPSDQGSSPAAETEAPAAPPSPTSTT